jgi:hypothetical protein
MDMDGYGWIWVDILFIHLFEGTNIISFRGPMILASLNLLINWNFILYAGAS